MIRTAVTVLALTLVTALSVAQTTASYPPPVPTCNPSNPNCCKTVGLCRR